MACRRIVPRTRLWRSLFIGKNRSGGFLHPVRALGVCVRTQNSRAFVAPAFRRALWKQADARLKAGATGTKTEFSHRLSRHRRRSTPRWASAIKRPPVVSMVTTENRILQSEGITGVHTTRNLCGGTGFIGSLAASSSGCRRFGGPELQRRRRHSRRVPFRSKTRRKESPGSKGCAPSQACGNIRQLRELEGDRPPVRGTTRLVP